MTTTGAPHHGEVRSRVVASDLDGTLLRPDGTVGPRTVRVWNRLGDLDIETVIVTARPPRWVDHLSGLVATGSRETARPRGLAICANGAFVYDVHERMVVESAGYSVEEALDIVSHVSGEFGSAAASFETDRGAFRSSTFDVGVASLGADDDVVVGDLREVPRDVVVGKILLRHSRWRDDTFVDELTNCLGARGVLAYSGAAGLAEISAPGVTKATRLAQWCAARGIAPEAVWAFGDMPNDIPMLRWAGRGVAVANAHPEAVAAADDRCGSNADEGVAAYVSRELGMNV